TLPHTVRGPRKVPLRIVTTAHEISHRLFVFRRRLNFRENAGAQHFRQLAGIATIRLDVRSRSNRNQRRGDDLAVDSLLPELALQRITARAGLVAPTYTPQSLPLYLLRSTPHAPTFT